MEDSFLCRESRSHLTIISTPPKFPTTPMQNGSKGYLCAGQEWVKAMPEDNRSERMATLDEMGDVRSEGRQS